MGTPKTKAIKARRYRVQGTTDTCGFLRIHTLTAKSKVEAVKLVQGQYSSRKKPKVSCIR